MLWLYIWIATIAGGLGGFFLEFKHGKYAITGSLVACITTTVLAIVLESWWGAMIPLIWLIGIYIGIILYSMTYEKKRK